jgi:hypothetical protein
VTEIRTAKQTLSPSVAAKYQQDHENMLALAATRASADYLATAAVVGKKEALKESEVTVRARERRGRMLDRIRNVEASVLRNSSHTTLGHAIKRDELLTLGAQDTDAELVAECVEELTRHWRFIRSESVYPSSPECAFALTRLKVRRTVACPPLPSSPTPDEPVVVKYGAIVALPDAELAQAVVYAFAESSGLPLAQLAYMLEIRTCTNWFTYTPAASTSIPEDPA